MKLVTKECHKETYHFALTVVKVAAQFGRRDSDDEPVNAVDLSGGYPWLVGEEGAKARSEFIAKLVARKRGLAIEAFAGSGVMPHRRHGVYALTSPGQFLGDKIVTWQFRPVEKNAFPNGSVSTTIRGAPRP
jgi:hypothetical protein